MYWAMHWEHLFLLPPRMHQGIQCGYSGGVIGAGDAWVVIPIAIGQNQQNQLHALNFCRFLMGLVWGERIQEVEEGQTNFLFF